MEYLPQKLMLNMIALLAVLLFLLSVVGVAVGYILFFDPLEFGRSPQMAGIFIIGLVVLITILISWILIIRHQPSGIMLLTGSAGLAIFLSWVVIIVLFIVYQVEDIFGLWIAFTILFLPLYIQIYLVNYDDQVIKWIDPNHKLMVD